MNGPRFDTLTRSLTTSRRTTVFTALGTLGLLLFRNQSAVAACKNVGRNCDRSSDCCQGAECRGGECTCKSGKDECSGKCYNLDADEAHCGSCDIACKEDESCCGGSCVDLSQDPENCGSCGSVCGENEFCRVGHAGTCFPCPDNTTLCGIHCCANDRTCCNGKCVDHLTDPFHCGACDNSCPGINLCTVEHGELVCHPLNDCCRDGRCINLQTDVHHCGACDRPCPGGFNVCLDGHCLVT